MSHGQINELYYHQPIKTHSLFRIERFQSQGQHSYKSIRTKESVSIRNEFNFGILRWPPFRCFGTLPWLPWRYANTLCSLKLTRWTAATAILAHKVGQRDAFYQYLISLSSLSITNLALNSVYKQVFHPPFPSNNINKQWTSLCSSVPGTSISVLGKSKSIKIKLRNERGGRKILFYTVSVV